MWQAEYTDTFGGEPNYCWVRRAKFHAIPNNPVYTRKRERDLVLRVARDELGMTGMRGDIIADYGDGWHWKPRGMCTVLMVTWCDDETKEEEE